MEEPRREDYGWVGPSRYGQGRWAIEGGENEYYAALEKYIEETPPIPMTEAEIEDFEKGTGRFAFFCLDEGDGKPRCKVQCPFCERGL